MRYSINNIKGKVSSSLTSNFLIHSVSYLLQIHQFDEAY